MDTRKCLLVSHLYEIRFSLGGVVLMQLSEKPSGGYPTLTPKAQRQEVKNWGRILYIVFNLHYS